MTRAGHANTRHRETTKSPAWVGAGTHCFAALGKRRGCGGVALLHKLVKGAPFQKQLVELLPDGLLKAPQTPTLLTWLDCRILPRDLH